LDRFLTEMLPDFFGDGSHDCLDIHAPVFLDGGGNGISSHEAGGEVGR
jgi:hypothetical protein